MRKYLALTLIAAFSLVPVVASARPPVCGPQKRIIDIIKNGFGEKEVWVGKIAKSEDPAVLYVSEEKGTWTFVTIRGGTACLIAAGQEPTSLAGNPI